MNWVFWLGILIILISVWCLCAPSFKPLSQILREVKRDIRENIKDNNGSEEN